MSVHVCSNKPHATYACELYDKQHAMYVHVCCGQHLDANSAAASYMPCMCVEQWQAC